MRHMIETYRNHPGEHCGSVAMRGLLEHYCGMELPEDVVFGLGSGVDCMLMPVPGVGSVAFGRTASMEVDLADALGVAYAEQVEDDNEVAWQEVREEGGPRDLTQRAPRKSASGERVDGLDPGLEAGGVLQRRPPKP